MITGDLAFVNSFIFNVSFTSLPAPKTHPLLPPSIIILGEPLLQVTSDGTLDFNLYVIIFYDLFFPSYLYIIYL